MALRELAEAEIAGELELEGYGAAYRDRSLERRLLFGTDSPSIPVASEDPILSPNRPLDIPLDLRHNVGAKLLRKLGWREGEGLGISSSGITVPINVTSIYGLL